jgi:hypothetical protein
MRSRRTQSQLPPSAADPDTGRTEPVVTYSRLPSEPEESLDVEGRVEPRLGVLPVDRDSRPSRVEARRIEAVRSGVRSVASSAPRVPIDDRHVEALVVDDLVDASVAAEADPAHSPADMPLRRRGRGARLALLVGLIALLGGAGVLAATFSGVLHGDGNVARIPAPGETAAGAGAPVAVDGDVRVVGGSTGVARVSTSAPGDTTAPTVAALDPAASATGEAAPKAIDPPPLPRLRPTQATEAPAAQPDQAAAPPVLANIPPATAGAPAVLPPPVLAPSAPPVLAPPVLAPPVLAPGPRNLGTLTVAPAPSGASASGDIDADALMDDVDRLLAERRAAQNAGAGAAPAAPPLLAPAPAGETVAYPPAAYPPAAYPPNAYPADSGLASAEPPPPPVRPRYRDILPDDEILPTPPANVPQGGVY